MRILSAFCLLNRTSFAAQRRSTLAGAALCRLLQTGLGEKSKLRRR